LGDYALSSGGGYPIPFHPAAVEKWLFGHWISPRAVEASGVYTLENHHLNSGQGYAPDLAYLTQIVIDHDPAHFLTIENRWFVSPNQGGSFFNEDTPLSAPLESGLVVFEVNRHLQSSEQIRRLVPARVEGEVLERVGAFQPGDRLEYVSPNGFRVTLDEITPPGQAVSFRVTLDDGYPPTVSLVEPADGAVISSGPVTMAATASDDTAVERVDFYLDGASPVGLIGSSTSAPYQILWDPATILDGVYTLTAHAVDRFGNEAMSAPRTITVRCHQVPVLTVPSDRAVNEGEPLLFYVLWNDPDEERAVLTTGSLPAGATVTTRLAGDVDGDDAVTILDVQSVLNALGTISPRHDLNSDGQVDVLDQQLVMNQLGKTLASADALMAGMVEWTPEFTQAGSYPIAFTVTDPFGLSATQAVNNTVTNHNRAPVLKPVVARLWHTAETSRS
jgi:hypothetical protein